MKEFLLLLVVAISIGYVHGHKKVLLSDVNTITLKAGEYTTGRRNAPVRQLKCVGGGAADKYTPRVAQCTKAGFDGLDYQWRCTAEMPTEFEFGKITVSCEGFDHPDDPYILYGSCGLEYDLEYTADLKRNVSAGRSKNDPLNILGTAAVVILIVIVLYVMCKGRTDEDGDQATPGVHYSGGGGGGGGPGYPPGPDDPGYPRKPTYRQPSPPPSYDESFRENTTRQRTAPNAAREEMRRGQPRTMGFGGLGGGQGQNEGPGFWTGAGLGTLGGYFLGRNTAPQPEPTRPASQTQRNFGFTRTPSPSSSRTSSDMHQSTGYGGTSRR